MEGVEAVEATIDGVFEKLPAERIEGGFNVIEVTGGEFGE